MHLFTKMNTVLYPGNQHMILEALTIFDPFTRSLTIQNSGHFASRDVNISWFSGSVAIWGSQTNMGETTRRKHGLPNNRFRVLRNVGNGWVAGGMEWLLIKLLRIIPENSLLSTSKASMRWWNCILTQVLGEHGFETFEHMQLVRKQV